MKFIGCSIYKTRKRELDSHLKVMKYVRQHKIQDVELQDNGNLNFLYTKESNMYLKHKHGEDPEMTMVIFELDGDHSEKHLY